MSPLTNLIILSFLTLIAAAAVVWLMLTAGERIARARDAEEAAPSSSRRSRADVDNDAVRGAKAPRKHAPADAGYLAPPGEATGVRVQRRRSRDDDPFERFLDPDRARKDDRER